MKSYSVKRRFKRLLVLAMVLLIGSSAMAAETYQLPDTLTAPEMTLTEAIEKIKAGNTDVLLAEIQRNQIVRESSAWFANYLPSIMIGGSVSGTGSPSNASQNPFKWSDAGAFSVGLDVSIDGTMFTDPYARSLSRETANLNYQMTIDEIIYEAVVAYWNLSAMKLTVQQAKANAESAITTYINTMEKYENGLASSLTLSQAKLSATTAGTNYSKTLSDYQTSKQAFATLLAIDIWTDFEVSDMPEIFYLDLPSARDLYIIYGESSDDIRSLNLSYQTASVNRDRTILNNTLPKLTVGAHYGSNLASTGNGYQDSVSVTANVSLPLDSYIPNSNASLQIQKSKDAVLASQISLSKGRESYLKALATAISTIQSAERNIEYQKVSLEVAIENYDLSQQSYDAGLLSASDLDKARDSKLSAELTLTEYQLTLLRAEYYLADILCIDLEDLKDKYGRKEEQQQ